MPEWLGTPSLVVLRASSTCHWQALEHALRSHAAFPSIWPLLTPVDRDKYVIAQPVVRQVLRGRSMKVFLQDILRVSGVFGVALEPTAAVLERLRTRNSSAISGLDPKRRPDHSASPGARTPPGDPETGRPSVRIAHIDTGYTPHIDLPAVTIDPGLNFMEPGQAPDEDVNHLGFPGHGTATLDVLGRLLMQWCPQLRNFTVVPYRVTNSEFVDCSGAEFALDRAIRHAAFDAGCDIICVPVADPMTPPLRVAEQIDAAYEAGVIVVAAAGEVFGEVSYPGRFDRVVTVSGITQEHCPWIAANCGVAVDVCAPATDQVAARTRWTGRKPDYDHAAFHGTGFAAAYVAAGAALWLQKALSLRGVDERDWRRVERFRRALRASAAKPRWWDTRLWGSGYLDVPELIKQALAGDAEVTQRPGATTQRW